MCYRIMCTHCGRPGYAGCGRHVEQVLGDVPADQRCQCQPTGPRAGGPSLWTQLKSWFKRIFPA